MMGKLSTVCLQLFCLLFTVHAWATSSIEIMEKKVKKAEEALSKLDKIEKKTHDFFNEMAATMEMKYKQFDYSQDYTRLSTAIEAAKKWLEQEKNLQAASSSQANTTDPIAEQWRTQGDFTQIKTTLQTAMRAAKDSIEQDEAGVDPDFVREIAEIIRELEEIPIIEDRKDRRNP